MPAIKHTVEAVQKIQNVIQLVRINRNTSLLYIASATRTNTEHDIEMRIIILFCLRPYELKPCFGAGTEIQSPTNIPTEHKNL